MRSRSREGDKGLSCLLPLIFLAVTVTGGGPREVSAAIMPTKTLHRFIGAQGYILGEDASLTGWDAYPQYGKVWLSQAQGISRWAYTPNRTATKDWFRTGFSTKLSNSYPYSFIFYPQPADVTLNLAIVNSVAPTASWNAASTPDPGLTIVKAPSLGTITDMGSTFQYTVDMTKAPLTTRIKAYSYTDTFSYYVTDSTIETLPASTSEQCVLGEVCHIGDPHRSRLVTVTATIIDKRVSRASTVARPRMMRAATGEPRPDTPEPQKKPFLLNGAYAGGEFRLSIDTAPEPNDRISYWFFFGSDLAMTQSALYPAALPYGVYNLFDGTRQNPGKLTALAIKQQAGRPGISDSDWILLDAGGNCLRAGNDGGITVDEEKYSLDMKAVPARGYIEVRARADATDQAVLTCYAYAGDTMLEVFPASVPAEPKNGDGGTLLYGPIEQASLLGFLAFLTTPGEGTVAAKWLTIDSGPPTPTSSRKESPGKKRRGSH